MRDANKSSYKQLVARSRARKGKKREFDQRFNSTRDKLFPRIQPAPKEKVDKSAQLIENLEKNYDQKLARAQQKAAESAAASEKKSGEAINNLSEQIQQGNKRFQGLSEGVQKALAKIQADKNKPTSQASKRPAQEANKRPEENTLDDSFLEDLRPTVPTTVVDKVKEVTNKANTPNTRNGLPVDTLIEKKKVDEEVVKSLVIDQHVSMGAEGYSYRATNLYGPRTGSNFVPGRPVGQHSRGVDLTSHDAAGNKVNIPIAIADGKIINVWKQGNTNPISTYQDKKGSGGYVMDVLAPNGKVLTYMHLGKSIYDNKEEYIGRQLKRGEVINTDGSWSGSGSAPHIKVSMSDYDRKKKQPRRNYTDEGNDPTQLILNNKYL